MADYSYFIVKIPSSSTHELNRFAAENGGEVIKHVPACKTAGHEHLSSDLDSNSNDGCEKEHNLFLKKRENDVNKLLTTISHHWRQPLNVLALSVQDLCELHDLNKLCNNDIKEFGRRAMGTIQDMSAVIDRFISSLNCERVETRKNIVHHIFDLLKLYQPEIEFNNTDLHFSCTCQNKTEIFDSFETYPACSYDLASNIIDVVKFNHVFTNIIDNAREAVCEALKKRIISKGTIDVSVAVSASLISICIKNNGEPIDEKIKDKIFLPYFTTKNTGSGTGLGLYTAKTVMTNFLHGQLEFHNCSDGVEFTMLLENDQHNAFCGAD
ncbi:MAG: sensor histidine kinase [Deferribacterales bacterium]